MERVQGMHIPAKIIVGDRRLTMHLMGLWQGLRRGADARVYADDYMAAIPEGFLTDCCIVSAAADGGCEVRLIGENLARRAGTGVPSARLSDLPPDSLLGAALRDHSVAFSHGAPIIDEGEARDGDGRRVLFRSIMVPLAGDDGRLVQLLAGARCRPCAADA